MLALTPGIPAEYAEFTRVVRQSKDRMDRGRLAGAIAPHQANDAALIDAETDIVERDRTAVPFADRLCLHASHLELDLGSPNAFKAHGVEQFLRIQPESQDRRAHPWPCFVQESIALSREQR